MPTGWPQVSLGDCSQSIQYGLTATSSSSGSGHRYIRITDIQDKKIDWQSVPFANEEASKCKKYCVQFDDILFARTGATVGKSYLVKDVPEPSVFASYLIRVRCKKELLYPEFAAYFFQSPAYWSQIIDGAEGTGQPNFNGTKLNQLRIPLPPVLEQRYIVAKLDDLTNRLNRVRAEIKRVPILAGMLRTQALNDVFGSLTNHIPLGQLASFVTSGSRGWAKYYAESGPAFIRVGDVRRKNIQLDTTNLQRVQPPRGSEGVRTALKGGDIVVTITADLGRVGVVPEELGLAFVNQHVALIRLNEPSDANWIAWYLSSDFGQKQLLSKDRGVTKAGLGLDDIRNVLVPMIEGHEREALLSKLDASFARANRLQAEAVRANALLNRLENTILAKAFSGELMLQDQVDERATRLVGHSSSRVA